MKDKIELFKGIFKKNIEISSNILILNNNSRFENQEQTKEAFSEKWKTWFIKSEDVDKKKFYDYQKRWYYELYGFRDEKEFSKFLNSKKIIFDAGCGLGYKAKWFADLSPNSLVIGIDISDSVLIAAKEYIDTKNLFFIKGDISDTFIKNSVIDYISCDQVLMHTENPELTLKELLRILKKGGKFHLMFMLKKLFHGNY